MHKKFRHSLLTFNFIFILMWISASFPATFVLAQQPQATQPTGMYITVITEEPQINVRLGPNAAIYPIVGRLLRGETAPALGRSPGGDWIKIQFPGAPNDSGWVYSPLVEVSPGILQIVEPPPTPLPPPTSTIDPTLLAQFNIIPTNTRLPTFTPPAELTHPSYTEKPALSSRNPVSIASIIITLAALGIVGFLLSLFLRR